jgi:hypothetical protein
MSKLEKAKYYVFLRGIRAIYRLVSFFLFLFFFPIIMSDSTTFSAETNSTIFPSSSNVVFTIPNMNHTLQIKLSNANFPSWRT